MFITTNATGGSQGSQDLPKSVIIIRHHNVAIWSAHDLDLAWPDLAKISMLRLNIGSGMLRLSSCMLRLSLTSSVQGGWGGQTLWRGGPESDTVADGRGASLD